VSVSGEREVWFKKGHVIREEASWLAQRLEEFATSPPFANHPMTRFWQDADGRESVADAVEALRERKRQEAEAGSKRRRRWRRG
jgi:hypothetical protein